jgi:hypothetical protein
VTESSLLSPGRRKLIDLFKAGSKDRGEDHLGDSISMADRKRGIAEIDQENGDFPSVICINRSRTVDHTDSVSNR